MVTGASKGIGAGIALALAAEGAAVAVNYTSSREDADRIVAKIKAAAGKAFAVQGSVASAADVERIFTETEKEVGNVNILVNNAESSPQHYSRTLTKPSSIASSTPMFSGFFSHRGGQWSRLARVEATSST